MTASNIEDGLFISDINYVNDNPVSGEFDTIITVCRTDPSSDESCSLDADSCEHIHIGLWDGENTTQDDFDRAVDATKQAIEDEGSVLVHCIAGISRSPTVVITALASLRDSSFEETRQTVWSARPSIKPDYHLRQLGRDYLGEITYEDRT
jgi:protein tyrosine phosphatase